MALTLADYASIAALVSAFCDVVSFGRESLEDSYRRYLADPNAQRRGAILKNTYSDDELESIRDRVKHCQEQFVQTGDGEGRKRCLCFVLKQAKIGNGGNLPFPEWEKTFDRLRCA